MAKIDTKSGRTIGKLKKNNRENSDSINTEQISAMERKSLTEARIEINKTENP